MDVTLTHWLSLCDKAPAFGAQAPAPSSGSLFGSPSPAPGGLFGSAPAPSSGLFGAPAPSTGGLFGAPAPSTGGLFGAPAPGGLFGSSAPAPAFGAPSSGGGLFGATAPASGGLFGSTAPASSSNFGSFGAPAPSAGGLFGSPAPAAGAFGSSFGAPTSSAPGGLFGSQNQTLVSPMATQGNIIPPAADAALQQQLAAIELQKKELEKLEVWRGNAPFNAVTVPFSLPESDVLKISPYSETLTTYRASPRSTTKIYPRGFGTSSLSSNNAISPTFDSYAASPMHTPAKIAASSAKRLVIRPDAHTPKPVIRLRLTNADMTLSPANDSSQEEVQEPELPSPKVLDLKEVEPKKSEEKAETPKVDTAFDIYNQVVGMSPRKSPKAIAKYIPTLSMSGYLTTPSLAEMETKSEAELAALSGFSITREGFGSVAWDGTVDVRGINLDSIISISHQDVAVYDNQEVDGTKPAIGEKLNRPAVISLYNTFPKKGGKNASEDAKQKFSKKLEKATAQMNADFISYDSVNGTWKFRVQHFSRYGLFDDDSDDEDDMEVVENPKVTPSVLPTVPEASTMQSNLHSGEHRELSLVLNENTTPTRFRVPQEEDDETDVEMADDDLPLISDVGIELRKIEDAGIEAYKSMFLSPATVHDTRKQMDMEEPEDDDVFEGEVPFLFNPPLLRFDPPRERDMAVCRGPSICSKLMEEEGLSRSSIDMSIRMARSFRVAWRPDGSFLSLASRTVLVQKRPQFSQTRKKSHNLPVLDIFMKYAKVNQNSSFSWEELSRKSVSAAIQDYIRVIPSVGNTPEYLLNQSLSLILCLLQACDEPTTFHLQRRDIAIEAAPYNPESRATDAFCKWLNSVCRKQGKAEIDSAKKRGDIYDAIWIALISGDISMASAIATENGHFQLAALIASGPGTSSLIHEQVRQWRETGASRTISPHLMRIYTLLGGDFQQEKEFFQKGDTSCNWMNRIRLYLTYGEKKGNDIYDLSTIFSKYEGEIAAGTAPNPIPPFNSERKSVVYKIMQLSKFVSEGISSQMSLSEVVLPQQHTHLEHDVEGSFLLAIVLSKLGCCSPLTELEQARLLSCYTTQLVSRGEWESAVNATLTQLGPTRLHEWRYKLAKDIILRHYSFESSKRKKYFTEKLKLPNSWLEEALADRAVNRNDILSYVKHVKEFSRHEAQAALEEVLVPSLLFQQPSIAQDSLNLMKTLLPSRHSLASSVVDFFDLSQAIKEISMRPLSEQSSRISQLIVKADEVEADLYQYKLKLDNLVRPSVSRIAPVEVPMSCFLVESLSGITFLKLQLRALESGSSIWDDKSGSSVMPMKSSSQLVANSEVVTKSRALKGYF
jgi:Nuclear protein 96/Nucleoporin autopeptidase